MCKMTFVHPTGKIFQYNFRVQTFVYQNLFFCSFANILVNSDGEGF